MNFFQRFLKAFREAKNPSVPSREEDSYMFNLLDTITSSVDGDEGAEYERLLRDELPSVTLDSVVITILLGELKPFLGKPLTAETIDELYNKVSAVVSSLYLEPLYFQTDLDGCISSFIFDGDSPATILDSTYWRPPSQRRSKYTSDVTRNHPFTGDCRE